MPVDYSRWEKYRNDNDSDQSNSEEEKKGKKPIVTVLEKPSRITIGPNNSSFTISNKPETIKLEKKTQLNYECWEKLAKEQSDSSENSSCEEQPSLVSNKVERKNVSLKEKEINYQKNGSINSTFMWSQTEDEVLLCLFVPQETRSSSLNVSIRQNELFVKINVKEKKVFDSFQSSEWIFDNELSEMKFIKTFQYKVIEPGKSIGLDSSKEDFINWELNNTSIDKSPRRILCIPLTKMSISHNVKIWWSNVFKDVCSEVKIDTSQISERVDKSNQFVTSWNKAEEMFKENHLEFIDKN